MSENFFNYAIKGTITLKNTEVYLLTDEGTKFKVKQSPQEILTSEKSWQIIPNTNVDGTIASINIESPSDELEETNCTLVGRVLIIGKKGAFVQMKISRPPLKTLRISLKQADLNMKVGQLWFVEGMRKGDSLVLVSAKFLE